ncbi:molybdenum cofactor guanylyltransferase [Thalassotalea insulae]|uniref:Molybdenum cofactor guanylyltransferase n=1 Tax=Thalassotalea insulae TaxID=2056778 RepID=A0ABQ6GP27_9GAMM|nr:molybdenum cofactor guanylyltransferase [Thalassotalea insulae]GLX77682.1 molybdenum cofactor guanylyltransferase [Thalassotalea insulae]
MALTNTCLGVVLAGGLSSRMGTDKALLTRKQDSLLAFSEKLLKQTGVAQVVVSGKQHGIADEVEQLGPMGGIYTILNKYQPNALLILPVDLPLMDVNSLKQLKLAGELSQQPCYFRDNYLPLYLPITALVQEFFNHSFASLNTITKTGKGPSIRALLAGLPSKTLTPKNNLALFNANTPEQWQQAQQHFSNHRSSHV